MAELQRGKGKNNRGKRTKDAGLRFALGPSFVSALTSVIYGPQWRQKFAGNTFLKIAQSGRVDVRSR